MSKLKWVPDEGEKYWYIVDHMLGVGNRTYRGSWWFDIACVKSGNCFRTREEARKVFRKIKKVLRGGLI